MNKPNLLNKKHLLITFIAMFSLTACDKVSGTFNDSLRSGTSANEDIEAPLSEKAERYRHALEVSNQFLSLWQQQEFQTIHDELVDPEVQDKLSVEKLSEIYNNVEQTFGEFVSFKPKQWAFEPKKAKKQYFLFSIKTVEHKGAKLNYLFQFVLDGEFKKLAGVYVRERPRFRAPGQIHSNKQ